MDILSNLQNFIGTNQQTQQVVCEPEKPINEVKPDLAATKNNFFDLEKFIQELNTQEEQKNKDRLFNQTYMSAYDVASSCICNILHKIRNTPIKNYANKWLPIVLRSYLGNAVHDFIQENSEQFTEKEVSIKVPSIRFSGRTDCHISNNNICEIKSLPFLEYIKIIKNETPRTNDFYQVLTYKYILENYLEEAKTHKEKTRTQKPIQDKYNIDYLQFIYIAHDLLSSDVETLDEAIKTTKHVKKVLNSRHNTFYFMTSLIINLNHCQVADHLEYIDKKIKRVNYYIDNNLDVRSDDEFIDPSSCYFCLYSSICQFKK